MTSLRSSIAAAMIVIVAAGFLVMGLAGILDPQGTVDVFSPGELSADMRNEVRAVYGGFGISIAILLLASLKAQSIAFGARFAVAIALIGMASGRVISFTMEATLSGYPAGFLIIELVLASLLLISLKLDEGALL